MNRCVDFNLNDYKKSIAKLSFDKRGIALCEYENEFLDFESIVKLKKSDDLPNAVDMLIINDSKKEVWFIEFKNQERERIKKYDIKRKILDSLISFYELFDRKYCCEYAKKYFAVYKCEKDIHNDLFSEFEDREIYFDLKEIKNKFLEEVITDCCLNFLEYFKINYGINWKGV